MLRKIAESVCGRVYFLANLQTPLKMFSWKFSENFQASHLLKHPWMAASEKLEKQ